MDPLTPTVNTLVTVAAVEKLGVPVYVKLLRLLISITTVLATVEVKNIV